MSGSLRVNHVRIAGVRYDDLATWFKTEHDLDAFEVVPLGAQRYRQGIAPLRGLTAFELFGDVDGRHPFEQATTRSTEGRAFVGWALRTDDIDSVAARVGKPASPPTSWVDAHGQAFTARWIMSGPTIGLPYFIQYLAAPATWRPDTATDTLPSLHAIELVGPERELDELKAWIGQLDFEIRVDVDTAPLRIVAVDIDRQGQHSRVEAS